MEPGARPARLARLMVMLAEFASVTSVVLPDVVSENFPHSCAYGVRRTQRRSERDRMNRGRTRDPSVPITLAPATGGLTEACPPPPALARAPVRAAA